jgi:hypothetical protein
MQYHVFATLAKTWYWPLKNTTVGSLMPAMLWVASDFGATSWALELHAKLLGSVPPGGVDVGGGVATH